ncbi:glycosyl hydrolase family 18 protein [bacterium]|nr:glycosyl hydrolase family 18 protein [bacterium]
MRNLLFSLIFISVYFSQETPAQPTISWMPTEYNLINESVSFNLSWNMWWGENGDHWKLYENSNNIYEDSLIPDSPNPQNSEINITLSSSGNYEYIVYLCNGLGENEVCNESNPVIITIYSNEEEDNDSGDSDLVFDKNIIGYYTSWSIYARNYEVSDIPAEKINIINYAFANINPNSGTITLGDSYADIDKFYPGDCWDEGCLRGNFHQLQILKENYPHLRTLISIGGWTWSTYFSDIAMTEESREIFAQSCVDFIVEYGFDGVDIDWEYPVEGGLEGNHYSSLDKENFTLLLEKIRELLDLQSSIDGNDYLLTVATTASSIYVENLEVDLIHPYLDWINLMSYDLHGPWGGDNNAVTNFNSSLYAISDDPSPYPINEDFNLDASVQLYIDLGVPREKINAGLPFYGRSFAGVPDENNGLFVSYTGVPGIGTWEAGVFDYWDLNNNYINLNGYVSYWHPEGKVPWLYNPFTQIMISYDNEESIGEKASYILEEEIGGVMFWEFSSDKFSHLLDVVNNVLNQNSNDNIIGDLNDDENVNILDVVILVEYILSSSTIELDGSDINNDADVNILDVIFIVNLILNN